jgi:iron complex transport system ATP-binding protein
MPLLQVKNVNFKYGHQWALSDIGFEVRPGEIIGLIGPNGSGKTTLLKLIDGLLAPSSGEIAIDGIGIGTMHRDALARMIAVVPQESPILFPFSVEEIVLMGRSPHLGKFAFETKADYEIARRAMKLTNTLDFAKRSIMELSGGERQRVWIARALTQEPTMMLLDEFTAFLDMHHQITLFDLMKSLNKTHHLTAIISTHDINMISQYASRLILLHAGKIHAIGAPADVVTRNNILTVYETDVLIDRHPKTGTPRVTMISNLS